MLCGFDLDGTLADSKSVYYTTVREYTDKHRLPLPPLLDLDMAFGSPTPPLFKGWGTPEKLKKRLDEISDILDQKLCGNPTAMPLFSGIFTLLEQLKNEGNILAIITSRELEPVLSVMKAHNIVQFFSLIRSGQDINQHGYRDKPHPDLLNSALKELHISEKNAVMIGDTWMDIKMAKNAHVFAVGVTWGYHPERILHVYKADRIISDPKQISEAVNHFTLHHTL